MPPTWLRFAPLLAGPVLVAAPTFNQDVAPILRDHCVQCHRPNDVAPMSLLDYESARPWAKSIRQAVLQGKMPPWSADPRYGHFSNDARLTPRDVQTIVQWVDAGAKKGDQPAPKMPAFVDGWHLGKPDVVVDIGENFAITPETDSYEHFTVEMNNKEGLWIRAAEILPGNRGVVHHVHVNLVANKGEAGPTTIQAMNALEKYLIKEGKLTRVRQDAPVLDNACATDAPDLPYIHGFQEGALASYLPGRAPDVFADGTAKWIPPRSKLEFVIHYARTPRLAQTDRTSVGLYLAPGPPARVLRRMDLRNFFFLIPAGTPNHEVRRCYTFEKDKLLLSITPHMHYRASNVTYELTRPNGKREVLLSVPAYNFNWQLVYRFQDPIRVEKGSLLTVVAHYDNSANNPSNPDPKQSIRWGDKSEEEMMTSWVEYLDAR